MLTDQTKRKLHKIELVLLITLIIAVPLLLFRPSITGFVPSDTKAQILNLTFTESQALNLASVSAEPIYISSFSISGEVIGSGDVAVYLTNGKSSSLVYTNVGQKKKAPLITGVATELAGAHGAELVQSAQSLLVEEGAKLSWPGDLGGNSASGAFTAVCMESCYLNSDSFTSTRFELLIFVEPGTTLKLQELLYTIG